MQVRDSAAAGDSATIETEKRTLAGRLCLRRFRALTDELGTSLAEEALILGALVVGVYAAIQYAGSEVATLWTTLLTVLLGLPPN